MKVLIIICLLVGSVCSQTAGVTTRYWDCCKMSCSWPGKASLAAGAKPVGACAKDGTTVLNDQNAVNTCSGSGGPAFTCSSNQPQVVNSTLAYGFAAAAFLKQTEANWCCACYQLTFTSSPLTGQTMIVQVSNTGSDVSTTQFDIQIPGGGTGIFNGCTTQWGAPNGGWGAQYGGVSSLAQCSQLPSALQSGCQFRFGWMKGVSNPNVNYKRVKCPAPITTISGCIRADENSFSG